MEAPQFFIHDFGMETQLVLSGSKDRHGDLHGPSLKVSRVIPHSESISDKLKGCWRIEFSSVKREKRLWFAYLHIYWCPKRTSVIETA